MDKILLKGRKLTQTVALLLTTSLSAPLFVACGSSNTANQPPVYDNRPTAQNTANRNTYPPRPQARQGLSTGQKVAILAGAAALYYLYNQHKNKQEQGATGKYYLSKNGRVYYRDAAGRAQWVTPPPGGIRVPEEQARQYQDFQGYNGRTTGRDLTDLAPVQ
ncbi:hypothetical protein IQ264_14340 [Phormidium sp. LEGE 05292]|uniref:hypothetical protein n=1 Tax=[Phormidium] sp. LEGE 05292 TaxID=767427 RepID=UPI00187ED79D|nr:hypothetical protein [Phormidium sp. LEGE 05292]MBE9226604.1 hypothetical protein [Phormidium sp. LEGE 05292]